MRVAIPGRTTTKDNMFSFNTASADKFTEALQSVIARYVAESPDGLAALSSKLGLPAITLQKIAKGAQKPKLELLISLEAQAQEPIEKHYWARLVDLSKTVSSQ